MIGGFPPALSGDVKVQIGLYRARAKDVRGRLDGVPKRPRSSICRTATFSPRAGEIRERREGLKRLGSELDGLQRASPWVLLTTWLFKRSNYLRRLLEGNATIAQQKLIAIYQLLKVCGEYSAMGHTN